MKINSYYYFLNVLSNQIRLNLKMAKIFLYVHYERSKFQAPSCMYTFRKISLFIYIYIYIYWFYISSWLILSIFWIASFYLSMLRLFITIISILSIWYLLFGIYSISPFHSRSFGNTFFKFNSAYRSRLVISSPVKRWLSIKITNTKSLYNNFPILKNNLYSYISLRFITSL